jgi:uncharacterized protein (UPF0261 family)
MTKIILLIGTYDTKDAELRFVAERIRDLGGAVLTMDVSVLGDPLQPTDVSKHDVAAAAASTIAEVIASGDENTGMQIMARGAALLTSRLHAEGRIDAMIGLGGTLGTDLVLDCAQALPLGVPKYVVSTVSFSPLIPPDRLAPDIQMILWAGGLYGLNTICQSSLAQAAGAVWGAAMGAMPLRRDRPLIGMTSLGSSCLSYMTRLKAPLEVRGFDVAVFHTTGMGGMAFEALARDGHFACSMDFSLPELGNLMVGSVAHAGADRLTNAGQRGIPQIVAPGCTDIFDLAGWQEVPPAYADRPFHAHNRLIKSAGFSTEERLALIREIGARLAGAKGPVHFVMPLQGLEAWDRPGQAFHDPEALRAVIAEVRAVIRPPVTLSEIDAHINDDAFCQRVLDIFDGWIADGTLSVQPGRQG